MKIGFVIDDSLDKADGVQQYVITLGGWLSAQGHKVHYLAGETYRKDIANVHSLTKNIKMNFNGNIVSTPLPASKSKVKKVLLDHNFDILHIQMPFSPFLAGKVIKHSSKSTALVGTFHILPFSKKEKRATKLLRILVFRSLRKLDIAVSVSKPAAKFAKKSFGLKSKILPNVVDVKRFATAKKLTKYDDGKINVVFLGRLVARKGCQQFLEVISELHKKHITQNVRVIICGKGPEDEKLKNFVNKNRLSHVVNFVGFVSEKEKPRYLATADIAVFPSLGGESFGIVLIEAMAAGAKVVMAGNNEGYQSVIGDHPRQLFDPLNTKDFASKLRHFIRNKRARDEASRWQTTAVREYDVNKLGKQLVELYRLSLQTKSSV